MGKQSNKPTPVSQEQYDKDLNASLEILHNDGASDQDLIDYTNDYKSRFTVAATTPQKKNPNQSGVSNSENGSSAFPSVKSGVDIVLDANKQVAKTKLPVEPKESYSKTIFKKAKSEVDDNLTEERLQQEKEQSGFLNTVGKIAKNVWNVTGTGLSAVNEALGGDKDYFVMDDYKPLQDEQKKYIEKAKRENLPLTPEAIQKGAEDIFRQEDKLQQLQKRLDANLPEDYDRQGIWKDLKLENLKKNDALKQAVITADVYQNQITEFDNFTKSIKNIPIENLSKTQIDTYNDLLTDAKEAKDGLGYLQENFPKLLKEVKTSDELLDVFKYNYNDYEKAYSNIKNFAKTLAGGTVKIAAETLSYIDEKTDDPGSKSSSADKMLKKGLKTTKEIANEVLDEASSEREQFISYKAKDINSFSDFGSYMADLGTNQLPIYATLAIAPELGSALLGTSQAGDQFRNMETEEMQPFAKQTSFGQKLLTSYVYGAAETLFERLGTVNVLKNIEQSIARASNGSRRLMRNGALSSVSTGAKQFGYNFGLEGTTEYLTAEAQIQADRNIAGKNVSTQQANENRSESFIGGALMGGGMTLAGGLWGGIAQQAKLYSDSQDIQKTKDILSKIQGLSDELNNNPNLTKEDKDIIYNKMNDLADQSFDIVVKNAEKGKTFSKEENSFLVAVNLMQDGLKTEFEKIKNSNLSTEQKKALTDELNASFNQLEQNRQKTLKGEFSTIPDSEKVFTPKAPQEDNLKDDEAPQPTSTTTQRVNLNAKTGSEVYTEETTTTEPDKVSTEPTSTNTEPTDEELLNDLDNANDDTSKQPIGELTNDEFLEAIQNDNVSDERLTDIATKLSNNEKLSNREQKIADKNKTAISQKTNATKQIKVANLPELTNDEYLDFIDNDKVSNERLLNIAYKKENQLPLSKLEKDLYDSQKKKVDTLQKNNRSWLKDETLNQDAELEFDNLLSGDAEQRRKDGQYTKDGVTYKRQEEQSNAPTGSKGTVKFADNVEQEFEYALQEEETLQPAHINSKRNPLHFVPEMQPKNRKDQSSQVASDKIADNPKLDEAGENNNAYSGAPVVNSRGEVIQGNNRSEGLKKHYQRGGTKYKQQLIDNAAKFGFTPEQVQGMNKPVLVRRLKVDDAKAIELGNYDAKDIETGGSRKIDPVTTSRRIPQQDKSKMTESIFENTDTETTLTEAIKQNFPVFFDKVRKYLNPAQVETILGKTGVPSADGVQDLVKLVQQFIFDGASTDLAEQFERLSYNAKQGLLKSLPNLLSVSKENSLLTEVQNAIVAVSDFTTSKVDDFKEWTNQTSMFDDQETPKQKYTELELNIAEDLINAKKQSDISNIFKDYTNLVKDSEGDIFNPEGTKGISKEEAIKQVFKTNNQDGNKQQEQPTTGQQASSEQDGANDAKGESKPRPETKPIQESPANEQGKGNTNAGEQGVKPSIEKLEEEYNSKTVDELIALKKKLYPNPDIESPMSPEEKLLDKVIAKKFSDINQAIVEKRKAKKEAEAKEKEQQPKAEPKQSKRKVRDEKIDQELDDAFKDLRDELNKLMSGINPELAIKAAKIIAIYTKAGIYKFSDIIEDAYAKFGEISKELFDAIKQGYASYYATAEDSIADQMDSNVRIFTYESIINKIQDNEQAEQPAEQPITDTKPIELKTKAIESKTDKLANDREAKIPTERKLEIANDLLFDIDSEIENVNDQLRLLGFYEPNKNDEMRENPHIYIERELKKDLTNFVKKLNERLKWEFDTDRKGKPQIASANVAPAGGDGTFILWVPNSEYGVYVSVSVKPKEYKEWYEQYELEPTLYWRVTTKKDKYRGLGNQWMNSEDFTIPNLVDKFTKAVSFYLKQENGSNNQQQPEQGVSNPIGTLQPNSKRPTEGSSQELLQKPSTTQGTGSRSQSQSNPIPRTTRTVKQSSTGQGDLFSGDANFLEVEPKQTAVTQEKPKDKVEVQIEQINQVEKQEPALVDFSLQDNEQEKFNATKKYTDNINALETLLTVIKEKRKATPEEKNTLAKYVGFGGLKEITFNPDNEEAWKESTIKYKDQVRRVIELTQELDQALGINNSLAEIRAGILTAHYTPKTIIDTMFNVLEKLGFKNGNILEPSAGIGNFIGYMPSKMRSNSNITAVELDNLTGNILKYLYDDVNTQIKGIQDAIIADNSQDVVISNVPFGNFKIFDKAFKGNREFLTKRIHNYFFAKALDKVREGGIVMFVTSKGVLDSKGNQNVREYLNQNADFLGAVRLPSTAFQNNANTSVVTDIIILRKNTTGEKNNPNFIDVVDLEVTDKNGETKTITINKYFKENRNVLLGNIVPGGMYSEKDYSLIDPDNKMGQIGERVSTMLEKHNGTFQPTTSLNATNRIETDQDLLYNTKNGNIAVTKEGKIVKRIGNELEEISMPSYVKLVSVKKYIEIREALFELITAEYTGQDSKVDKLRQQLNFAYNLKRTISAKEFNRIATEDGDGFNVLALENQAGEKADIFTKRTISPLQQKQNTDNVDEAIIISLYENAKVDMDRIAELMNKPVKEILELAKGKIFESPTGGFFTRDEYLSGNVKKKLAEVNKAIESGYTEFENNKAELEAVIPKDIPAVSIEVRLGSRWVPLDIINDFADHLFKEGSVVINYAKSTDTYNNNGKSSSVNATEKWGTKRKNGADLLIDALHAATPAIYDTTEDGKRILNKEETEKAVQKFEEIRAEFENWVYTNAERRERLGQIYNEKYNTTVRRKYEGSHLNIPGINGVNLFPHQKDAIWMLLQNNGGIIDHIVGAGKTFVMVAGTAEMKRTVVAKKPMILALKSTIPQIVDTYKQSYPLAKILAPSEKDFQAKNRQKLFSQIALNDWDIIIMSHENYQAIPHSPEYITKQIEDEIAEIEAERDALSSDKKALAGLEKRLNNLQAKLEKLTDVAKDNLVYFQQMGIDHIMVDESQQFKNLAYMTKQRNVAGLSKPEGSRRAFNLLIGMRYLQDLFGSDKGTTFLSGTPISNSMVEMYSLLKYMRPNKMKELGFDTFDQWATTFANPTNEIEYTVTGQFKSKTRFREFINVPELSLLYNEIADVRNDDNLVLDKPKMKGGDYTSVFIEMSPEQADYGQRIIQFAKTKDGSVLGLNLSDNQLTAYMLLATNLSSKMAIDMRLINKDYPYDPNGKVGKLTDEVVKVYQISNEHKGTQLIFSDLGTPKNKNNQSELLKDYMEDELSVPQDTLVEIFGNYTEEGHKYQPIASIKEKAIDVLEIEEKDFDEFLEQARQSGESFNLYSEVKKRLIEKGIPENEIVFIHDYNNQRAKEKLFEKVNNGEIRVILGSTQKLGTGVNVQKRLAAIHHLDVPWRPSDMEQRNGRGIRQGNWIAKLYLDNEIPVYAYATIRTLDAYKYQLLQTKENFLRQIKSGSVEDRVIREADDQAGFAVMVAELSGNKDILLKFKLEQEKERLTKQRRNFEGSLYEAQGNVRKLESNIPAIEENVSKTKKDIESITNKAEYIVTKDEETGIETKKLKIDNINGEVLQPEKDSKEAKEKKPVDRTEYGKKAIELVAQTVKNIKLDEYTKAFDINGLPILAKVTNQREVSNGKEYIIQKTALAILSPTGQTYTVNNSTIAGVLLNNIQKAIENIPVVLEMQEKVLDKNKKDLAEYKELAKNDKFPKEEELKNVAAELKEVDQRIKDFEKDTDEVQLEFEEKPQDDKIRIGDVVYPSFNEDVQVSVVEGKNLKTDETNYLVKINKPLDYQNEYKKIVEPFFLEYGGEWNKSHKAIIFSNKENAIAVLDLLDRRLSLKNDFQNIINEPNEGYGNNRTLALNTTKDGQKFLSLTEPGTEYSNSSQPNLWQQGDTDSGDNNRRSVRAIWTKYKNIQFKGTTKVKNAEDVAQIMSLLENKYNEHAFAIHIDQDGNSHIQFLSIGGITGTVVDPRIVAAGVSKFNSKKVYLVHNHPSGKMQPSDADMRITKQLREGLNPLGIIFEHIIMNTYLKQYVHIDNDNEFTVNTRGENTFAKTLTPIALTEQEILENHYGKVTGSDIAFAIIQNFRFSAMPKNAILVMNNSNQVIGNYVFSNGDITYEEILKFVSETATATSIIFYGNQANNLNEVNDFKRNLAKLDITVLDKIVTSSDNETVQGYYKSMSDDGMLYEHIEQYGTGNNKFDKNNLRDSNENNNLASNNNDNEIFQQISQRNNGENSKENSRVEQIAAAFRRSYRANEKKLKGSELEDFEKQAALKYAKDNNLWYNDILEFGTPTNAGGNEHTIVYNEKENYLYKSNNLYNSKFLVSHYLEKIRLHNLIFPNTKYEFVGFTGIDKGPDKVPYIEPIAKQKFIPNAQQATTEQIDVYMTSLGFTHVVSDSYRRGNIAVHDLAPRNVLIDADGDIYVIDAEFINAEFNNPNKPGDYETGEQTINELHEPSSSYNKDLRLPQTIARQTLDLMKQDKRNNVDNNTMLKNAVSLIQNTDWYNDLDSTQQARVNNTTLKSLLENAIKELNYLENKVDYYKQQLIDNKLTARQVFDDIIAFLKTNQIKGKITPTEINRLIKSAAQITIRKDTAKALDDFMNIYEIIKEKALLRSDKGAREKAEVDYVLPIVESLVASGYDLDMVLDYFETDSQKRMAEIQYHKEKSKYATEEEQVNKTKEALEKQKQDLINATYTSFREGLKKARLYWFNLISDRSYVPANLISKTGMQQTYYQFKNTKGYGHSAKEMYENAYNKIWKGLTQNKIELLHDVIQMMRIITIDENREINGLAPVQHPNNLSSTDAKTWLQHQKDTLGEKEFSNIEKRAKQYFKAYQEVLDLKLENGFISQETYDALNGLDYQPRLFLHHAVNFDGDLSFEQKQHIILRSGLSKEQVKGLEDGSANSLILDAQWLLSNSISTLYQDIADNNLNRLFIAEEFPIAQAKYDDLIAKPAEDLTKDEKRFVKYFKELSDKVIPNEVIGFNSNTNDPIYKLETPKNFVNKYYWADGVKHQFFMEERLAQEFDGAKGLFLNESNKQTVGNITGSRIVKWFATGNNPLFVIVNTPRDFMWNILVSEQYNSLLPVAMAQMTYQLFPSTYDFIRTKLGRENTDMNLYLQHGGSMDYLHKQGDIADKSFADKYIVKPLTSVFGKNNQPIVEDKLRNNYVTKAVGALNEWSELAFRIATFRRSINAQLEEIGVNNESEITDTIDENGIVTQTRKEILDNIYRKATYDARSILDFSQGGRLTKDLEEFVPYFNVGIQATRSYADAMKKRPISTTLKTFQIATAGAAGFITLAMMLLAGDDDEPEEEAGKTTERKYVEFMQGVSEETRSKYYLIPTKKRDENGNRIAYKIAKDQFLIPYTNIVETLIENKIRTRAGYKEIPSEKISKRLMKDIFEFNLSAKSMKDVPLFKAGVAWYAGYDLYRNKPLDKYAKSEALEGINNPQVEEFYKQLGMQFKISPIRTKSAIESIITSPQSNPYLATGYEVMDYSFTDKSMEHLGSGVKEMLLKGLKNRTTTKSTEWTRTENLVKDSKDQQLDAMLKEEAIRKLFKDKAEAIFDEEITDKAKLYKKYTEVKQELKEQYGDDPNYDSYRSSFKRKFNEMKKAAETDNVMKKIKKEKSPGARAIMIEQIYGDINSPQNAELKKELKKAGVINDATEEYLNK
jgi:N12 class adenine-specific DNA methylase